MGLSPAEYLNGVLRTAKSDLSVEKQVDNCIVSIQGEWGEITNYVKKTLYHGKELDPNILADELGDVLFYVFWLNYAINNDFTGESFKNTFSSAFENCGGHFRYDLMACEHAYQVLQAISILNARAISAIKNYQLGRNINSVFKEQIETSCFGLLRALCLFSLHCDFSCTWGYIAQKNVEKLAKRYPTGFSIAASENRTV
jgi:NTP pyrophosphatase (non-canonical NTP hydrolase)